MNLLVSMGLFRLFLGVETDAVVGLETLGRGIERAQNHRALDILRRREVHTCFNLLVFDPESTFTAVRQNIDFMRRQSYFPLNFCRVEVYAGTPLEERLRSEGRLLGDFYGYSYTIRDAQVQRAYEMFREVFWPRNFGPRGMHHESMKLDYNFHVLRHFHRERASRSLERRVKGLVLELNQNSAELMDRICDFAESADGTSEAARERLAAELGAARRESDEEIRGRVEATLRQIEALAARPKRRRFRESAMSAAAAAALIAATAGCGPSQSGRTHMCEMAPPPPGPVERRLSGDDLAKVQTMVQQRVEAELRAIIDELELAGVPIALELLIDGRGVLEECYALEDPTRAAAERICQGLGQMEFPFLAQGVGVLHRAQIRVAVPIQKIEDDTHMCEMAPRPMDDDTHMCEMAPPPIAPAPPESDDESGG